VALKISLKPDEKIFIGGAVVRNGDSHVELNILNDVPLLREKDVLTEQEADSVCKRIYLCVQLMYMDQYNLKNYQKNYCKLIDEVLDEVPSGVGILAEINNNLACGKYYQALKCARSLMEFEQGHLGHAKQLA
jgi:flagellar protein FlbT